MRKVLSLILFLIVIWIISVWFLGNRTEHNLKTFISESNQIIKGKLVNLELVNFHKSFFGATGEVIFHSDNSYTNQKLEGLKLFIVIRHGPFFMNASGVTIGASEWRIAIAESRKEVRGKSQSLASEKNTRSTLIAKINFDRKVHYSLSNSTIKLLNEMSGVYDFNNRTNDLSLSLHDFKFKNNSIKLASDKLQFRFLMKGGFSLENSLISVDFQTSRLRYQHKGIHKLIEGSVRGKSEFFVKKGVISARINAVFKKVLNTEQIFDLIKTEVNLHGVSSIGILNFLEALDQISDHKQQTTWVLEEQGEFPDGQDQIWQHYDQIKRLTHQLPLIVNEKVLSVNSLAVFTVKLQGKGVSTISGTLQSRAQEHKGKILKTGGDVSIKESNLKRRSEISSLLGLVLSNLQGQAEVRLDNGLFREILKNSTIKKRQFDLIWKDNKLLMK